jgi:hypothetical protein
MKGQKKLLQDILRWEDVIQKNREILNTPDLEKIDYIAADTRIKIAHRALEGRRAELAKLISQ